MRLVSFSIDCTHAAAVQKQHLPCDKQSQDYRQLLACSTWLHGHTHWFMHN